MLTPAEIREHVETDLPDAALQRFIDANQEAIEKKIGGSSSHTDHLEAFGTRRISLTRDAASITSIKVRRTPDSDEVTLGANDYRFHPPRTLVRLTEGGEPAAVWRGHIEVVFAPIDDANLRETVLVHLVQIDLEYEGLASHKEGDYSEASPDYQAERQAILSRLDGRQAFMA